MKRRMGLWIGLILLAVFPFDGLAEEYHEHLTPEAFWSFNRCRSKSPEVLDSSPGRHHLTFTGIGASCAEKGKYGRGLGLDGGGAAARTEGNVLAFTDQLTLSSWVYLHRLSGRQDIVRKWYAPDSYGLFLVDGKFVFSVAFPGGSTYEVSAPATKRQWTHVTGVFDGAGTTKSIRIYINGNKRDEKEITDNPPLQQSTRSVVIGSHAFRGRIDEVGLYNAVLTDHEIRNLAGQDNPSYFGSDTFVYPGFLRGTFIGDQFSPEEAGYDFYVGRLGRWLEGAPQGSQACRITDTWGNDVINGGSIPGNQRCAFVYEAALIARPERTYGFWWMAGPDHDDASDFKKKGSNLSLFGRAQAERAGSQWHSYNHLVGGRTLFADIERCINCTFENDTAGWAQCEPFESPPNACKDNQAVLEGFLKRAAALGFTPGVYTRADVWQEFFGKDYVPQQGSGNPIPFVLWLTGYNTTDTEGGGPHPVEQVGQDLQTAEQQALGGMRTVVWQHHINRPDWDATRQNPSKGFVPRPVPVPPPSVSVLIPTDDHRPPGIPLCPDDGYFVSNNVFEYSSPGGCFSSWHWLWRLQQERTSGGAKYFHVKVKYVNGPGAPVQISIGEILSTSWNGVYGPDYSTGGLPETISVGQTLDLETTSPDGFPGTQHDGYFILYIMPVGGPYPPAGLYRFEIVEIYAVDVSTGAMTVMYP